MKKILLTSDGLATENIKNTVKENSNKHDKIAILATDTNKEISKYYTDIISENFKKIGYTNFEIIDFENYNKYNLSEFNIFYVCGGNTFSILNYARKVNLKNNIEKLFVRNGLYIGVSAGSIIMQENINTANEISPDPNFINLEDFTGLNFTNIFLTPHFTESEETQVLNFEEKYNMKVEKLTDNEAIFIKGDKILRI
jgi:dipeptidase E